MLATMLGVPLASAGATAPRATAPQASSPPVALAVTARGSSVSIRASTVVACDPATAWSVLTDYRGYASFVPGVETSRVVRRSGSQVIVEQTALAPLALVGVPVDVVYRITEFAPTRIVSRALLDGGDTLQSEYRLTPEPNGTRLDYRGQLTARPGLLAALRRKVGEDAIGEHLRALAREMEREARARAPHTATLIGAEDH